VDAADLMANPANWREHPQYQRNALGGALGEVGWVQGVIVNRTTGRLIDGHLRVMLARERGEQVPVTYVELSEDEERLVLATLDPLAALAVTNEDALADLLAETDSDDQALAELLGELVFDVEPSASAGGVRARRDLGRPAKDIEAIINEVIGQLTQFPDAEVRITLEVQVWRDQGFDDATIRTVSENSRTLKFEDFGFEEE